MKTIEHLLDTIDQLATGFITDLSAMPDNFIATMAGLPWPAALLLTLCIMLLILLAVIDFRTYLLPDKFVLPLAIGAIGFHFSTGFALITPISMLFGAVAGGGFLWIIRWAATKYYGQDPLGLGDVKLMIAGGLLIGIDQIFIALTVGAFAGVILGIILWAVTNIKSDEPVSLGRFQLPAGPGFCLGTICSVVLILS
jgi:leader peptidase (prepilin peptidase)/N-methyltransferase